VATRHPGNSSASTGSRALTEGRWEDARAAFESALIESETPEALEGLSWAAWWLDDAAAVFNARERAYRLYWARADAAGAARMAIWLAIDHLDFNGAMAVASGWFQRATRLLSPHAIGTEHGWLAFLEGYLALLDGDAETAQTSARRAADIGRELSIPDLEMLGLALEGGTLVSAAEVGEGMRCLDEAAATALTGDATVPISCAWALCFLVTACLEVRDYRRAFEWTDRIADFADRYRSRYMLGFCRANYGAVKLSRGRWTDAEADLLAAADALERSRPAMVGDALVWLAELRRRQGRHDDAIELLDRAGDSAAAATCRGWIALDGGDSSRAAELAERCLRQAGDTRRLDSVPALELLVRARAAQDDLRAAAGAVAELRILAEMVGTAHLRACYAKAEGILAAAGGRHDDARRRLEDAIAGFDRIGAVFESLTARIELAESLIALGRVDVAEEEARGAVDGLTALGASIDAARAQRTLSRCSAPEPTAVRPAEEVTARERDVLPLLAEGLTNRQIAERLMVSEHTVHRHVTNMLRKLDLPSRAAAAAYAVRRDVSSGRNG
jgi:LuxR family transcriptional regulator, maltose regulon positive regulatory protein